MQYDIQHWDMVTSVQQMISRASDLLNAAMIDHSPVTDYPIEKTAERMLKLLDDH
jgi:hypothetical protein